MWGARPANGENRPSPRAGMSFTGNNPDHQPKMLKIAGLAAVVPTFLRGVKRKLLPVPPARLESLVQMRGHGCGADNRRFGLRQGNRDLARMQVEDGFAEMRDVLFIAQAA